RRRRGDRREAADLARGAPRRRPVRRERPVTVWTRPSRRVPVGIGVGYEVTVGSDLLATAAAVIEEHSVVVVTDQHVGPLHGPPLVAALESAGRSVTTLTVPAGESSKNLATWGE